MEPKCYVTIFNVPALNETLKTSSNPTIVSTVEFDNVNTEYGIEYDNINITFGIFLDQSRTRPIGNYTIEGFYQGYEMNELKRASVEIDGSGLNRTAKKVEGKTHFRVDFMTSVKYKNSGPYTKRQSLWGGANVPVDDSGNKAGKKHIILWHTVPVIVSGAPLLAGCSTMMILGPFVYVLFLSLAIFLSFS
ncbi:protein NDR1-like [Neltuma alba]|uniref:protein NDR1-like n=1 Tax=Neltuma alba TaxID=207710 RepID=UPI0010A2FC83|nr:protein NDR1-like [Prosopis alba]